MSIFSDLKRAMALKRAWDRLKEAKKMGKLWGVLYALSGAVVTSILLQITGACPSLMSNLPLIAGTAIGSTVTWIVARPKNGAKTKALLVGAGGVALAAVIEEINKVCGPGFTEKIPAMAAAGAWVGLGLWLNKKGGL